MPQITLYNFSNSPFGRRVYFCLLYKGIPFDLVFVNKRTWEELDFCAKKIVPTLTINGETRQESLELCFWLDEMLPGTPKIGGRNSFEVQKIRDLNTWINETIFSNFFRLAFDPDVRDGDWYRTREATPATSEAPEKIRERLPAVFEHAAASFAIGPARHALQRAVEELERHVEDGLFMGGFELPTIADFSAYGQIALNELLAWTPRENFLQSNAIRDWVGRVERHLPVGADMIPKDLRKAPLPLIRPLA